MPVTSYLSRINRSNSQSDPEEDVDAEVDAEEDVEEEVDDEVEEEVDEDPITQVFRKYGKKKTPEESMVTSSTKGIQPFNDSEYYVTIDSGCSNVCVGEEVLNDYQMKVIEARLERERESLLCLSLD